MTLTIWKCQKCGEELWYNDDSLEKVQCKCGEWMEIVDEINYSKD